MCIADYVFLQHGYTAVKDTYTICYKTLHTKIYVVDLYFNMNKDISKLFCYTTLNIPKVNTRHIH